ncbi:MAG: hypothetical protein AAF356_05650 [Planctomycetota bacterium]
MLHTTETIAGTSTAAAGAAQGDRRGAVLAALCVLCGAAGAAHASWGDRQLALLDSALVPPAPLFISFSEGVTGFSIELGGFEPGPYAVLLSVFGGANGTGSVIDSQVLSFNGALPVADTLAFSFLAPTDAIGSVSIDVSIPGGGSGGRGAGRVLLRQPDGDYPVTRRRGPARGRWGARRTSASMLRVCALARG